MIHCLLRKFNRQQIREKCLFTTHESVTGSITGTIEDGAPEVMTTLVLPYRDDEYGVPVLQFSESDTDSETETTVSKPKTNKTLPSVGPPQILQVCMTCLDRS